MSESESTPRVSGSVQDKPEATRSGSAETSTPDKEARRKEQG